MVRINKAREDVDLKERKKEQDRELKEERKSARENFLRKTCHTGISVGDEHLS
jgi:hypothetical protein